MNILGFDPGASGAMAIMSKEHRLLKVFNFSDKTEQDISREVWLDGSSAYRAYLEQVHARPGQGVSSMFKFGQSYGFLRGLLSAFSVPYFDVIPQKWQQGIGLGKKYPTQKDRKKVAQATAQQWFPYMGHFITQQNADAVLVLTAEYGWRQAYGEE